MAALKQAIMTLLAWKRNRDQPRSENSLRRTKTTLNQAKQAPSLPTSGKDETVAPKNSCDEEDHASDLTKVLLMSDFR